MKTIMFMNIKRVIPGTNLLEGVEYKLKDETLSNFILGVKTIDGSDVIVQKYPELAYHIEDNKNGGHVHAEMMAKYAHVAKYSSEPWKFFEVKEVLRPGEWYGWRQMSENDTFKAHNEYRMTRKRRRSINGISFIEAEIIPLESGQVYFYPTIEGECFIKKQIWSGDSFDYKCLKAGLIHLDSEEAKKHARAIFTTGE